MKNRSISNFKTFVSILILSICCLTNAVELKLFDENTSGWSSAAILSTDQQVSGSYSLKWDNYGSGSSKLNLSTPTLPGDLSNYTQISFWVYSPGNVTSEFNLIINCPNGYFYKLHNIVDWQGWKQLVIPMNSLLKAYSPEMTDVNNIEFLNYGWGTQYTQGAELYFDNIVLSDRDDTIEYLLLDEDCSLWNNLEISTEQAKRGNLSGKWSNFGTSNSVAEIATDDIPSDWTKLSSISFWLYSSAVSVAEFNLIIDAGVSYFYKKQIPVDWQGWKRFEYPLSSFGNAYGTADWADVTDLKLYNFGWGVNPVGDSNLKVYFDDVRLNYSYKFFFNDNASLFSETSRETSSDLVWHGNASAKLDDFDTSNKTYQINYPEIITDWSNYDTLSFRMYSNNTSGSQFNLIIDAGNSYFYKKQIPVDWQGWKRVEIPLSEFGNAYGTADWTDVTAFKLYNFGWGINPANNGNEVYIDDIELYKSSTFIGIDWSTIITAAENSGDVNLDFQSMLTRGNGLVTVKRPYTLQEIITYGDEAGVDMWEDRLDNFPSTHPNKLIFGLAMSDCATRIHYRLFDASLKVISENDPDALSYIVAQLSEVVGHNTGRPAWHPLQRPGWSKCEYTDYTPLDAAGDGVWLATGWGLFAIIDTLEMVGDRLDPVLKEKCVEFIKDEIAEIEISWNKSIPGYIGSPGSNQFIIPNAGLLYACLYTERQDSTLALAIRNSLASLNVMGQDGASLEGIAYNDMIIPYICRAAMMLDDNNTTSLLDNSFLQKNGDWMISHLMPGNYILNAFDGPSPIYSRMPDSFGMLCALYQKPEYYWIGENIYNNDYPWTSPVRLLYFYNKLTTSTQPQSYASYPSRNLMAWRSGWNNSTDTGVWAKGSASDDRHSHDDAGHVTVIFGENPVLIETGSALYSNVDKAVKFDAVAGHNVLQATANSTKSDCLMTVNSLASSGGDVTINATSAYTDVDNWQRNIVFNYSTVTITDQIDLSANKVGNTAEWLRFHTGSATPVTISGAGTNWTVTWSNNQITFVADKNITVSQLEWDNRSLSATEGTHYCLVIKTVDSTDTLDIVTTVTNN